jgi:hypothetical protein
MKQEVWKSVPGYKKFHEVSSLGRVRSLPRMVRYKDGRAYLKRERLLRAHPKQGYPSVALADGKRICVHTLVAEAFIGRKPKNARTVNHKDGKKGNNEYVNLEWASYAENNRHARLMRLNMQDGSRCNLTKFNQDVVDAIRILWPTKRFTRAELGALFRISKQHVYEIAYRKSRVLSRD